MPTAPTIESRHAAQWTNDCGGKKDFDGPILSISTRYWPSTGGFMVGQYIGGVFSFVDPPPRKPSAKASILLNLADDNYLTLRERGFEADTEDEVKALVEATRKATTSNLNAGSGSVSIFPLLTVEGGPC